MKFDQKKDHPPSRICRQYTISYFLHYNYIIIIMSYYYYREQGFQFFLIMLKMDFQGFQLQWNL